MKHPLLLPLSNKKCGISFISFVVLHILLCGTTVFSQQVGRIRISGTIGPITGSYIQRAIAHASEQKFKCLVIQLDTPGGLLNTTKEIVQYFFASPVPTVVYVAPAGATATSAGCFITLAADIAVMAPGTSIGAAHPVTAGGGGSSDTGNDNVMKKKLENFAVGFIESIALRRQRNVEWAKASVRESAAITAEKALELKVIDLIAKDDADLLGQIDGRVVNGTALQTKGAGITEIPMLLRESVFQRLWSPEILYILMLVAIYGIIGELSNPGAILPAVVGSIALILALFMGSILSVNITGVALIVLAIALFITEIFTPTHGILTAGGIISFFIGSLLLFDTPESVFKLSLALIIPATAVSALFFIFIFGAGLRAQLLPKKTGRESMIGSTAKAVSDIDASSGKVFFDGEYWNAKSGKPIEQGTEVTILEIQGLVLLVEAK